MEPVWWLIFAGCVALLWALITWILPGRPFFIRLHRWGGQGERPTVREVVDEDEHPQPQPRRNLRARLAALQRARARVQEGLVLDEVERGSSSNDEPDYSMEEGEGEKEGEGKKIGTKKLKRIQEKAERKAMREQELAMREEGKRREALKLEERKREMEAGKKQQLQEAEKERLRKEEEERRAEEEYRILKESFVVEEEGEDAANEDEEARSIGEFIEHVKRVKVVVMEDVAAEFGLKTQEVIARVQSLQESGELTGVIDDRGKFIYISPDEMEAVSVFIKQRGRVSIAELVSSSNTLINLQPELPQQLLYK